ncbi:hypothetical protein L9F63_026206, partial [Diploptera punctata]
SHRRGWNFLFQIRFLRQIQSVQKERVNAGNFHGRSCYDDLEEDFRAVRPWSIARVKTTLEDARRSLWRNRGRSGRRDMYKIILVINLSCKLFTNKIKTLIN